MVSQSMRRDKKRRRRRRRRLRRRRRRERPSSFKQIWSKLKELTGSQLELSLLELKMKPMIDGVILLLLSIKLLLLNI